MDKERWQLVDELAKAALELPKAQRDTYLRRVGNSESIIQEVQHLLDCASAADSFLEAPYCDVIGKTRIVRLLAEEPLELGEDFSVIEKIGEGGMGAVFLVEQHRPLQRRLALKVIREPDASPEIMARFSAEYQSLAWLNHRYIAQIFMAGCTTDGRPYFTMEYLPGLQIASYCRLRGLGLQERLRLFLKVCDGVQHAHQRGVIHRDLKPSNILILEQDCECIPKIIDFGIAQTIHGVSDSSPHLFDDPLQISGTPSYMSPEQTRQEGEVDTRTDVYSLGAILFELICGRPPLGFSGKRTSIPSIFKKIQTCETPVPSKQWKDDPERIMEASGLCIPVAFIKKHLDPVILRALQKDPGRRYAAVYDLATDVATILEKGRAIPISTLRRFLTWLSPSPHPSRFKDALPSGRKHHLTHGRTIRWRF